MSQKLTIGKLAKQSAVSIETVRYYQRIGLIREPKKPKQGYRIYPEENIKNLKFIKRAQQLGFSLKEIIDLMTMSKSDCVNVRKKASNKLISIEDKISGLQKLAKTLKQLMNTCDVQTKNKPCPIIETLFNE